LKQLPICIVNGPLVDGPSGLQLNQHTGSFLADLARRIGGLRVVQYALRTGVEDEVGGLNQFRVDDHPPLEARGFPYRVDHPLLKQVDRLRVYISMAFELRRAPWSYLFFPGTLPLYASAVCRHLGRPYGVYVRGAVDLDRPSIRAGLAAARVIVCNNPHTARELAGRNPKILVAAPMMEVGPDDVQGERLVARRGTLRILYVGRLESSKGLLELTAAAATLASEGRSFELHLAGNGPLSGVENLPECLRSRTHFHGFVPDKAGLAALYRDADIFVLPSHAEGFPRVLYEALTYGLPTVTTFVGGIPALVEDGREVLRIEPRDPAGLSAVLRRLLDDASLRSQLGAAALQTMRRFHSAARPEHAALVEQEMMR
jgi:glycosyltransferase involved in cell wall biosynthesis